MFNAAWPLAAPRPGSACLLLGVTPTAAIVAGLGGYCQCFDGCAVLTSPARLNQQEQQQAKSRKIAERKMLMRVHSLNRQLQSQR